MSKNSYSTKRIERFVDDLISQGCTVRPSKSGWMIYFPDGVTSMPMHTSISDSRALMRIKRVVVNAGLEWRGI